jgi:hypothetical protein
MTTLPKYDFEAFQTWARQTYDIPDSVVYIKPGHGQPNRGKEETQACLWLGSFTGFRLSWEQLYLPEHKTIDELCAHLSVQFPLQAEAGQMTLEWSL